MLRQQMSWISLLSISSDPCMTSFNLSAPQFALTFTSTEHHEGWITNIISSYEAISQFLTARKPTEILLKSTFWSLLTLRQRKRAFPTQFSDPFEFECTYCNFLWTNAFAKATKCFPNENPRFLLTICGWHYGKLVLDAMRAEKNICSHIAAKNRMDLFYFEGQSSVNVLPYPWMWLNIKTWQIDCGSTGKRLPNYCVANRFISAWKKSSFITQRHCLHSVAHFKPCINILRQTCSKLHALVYISKPPYGYTHSVFFICKSMQTHHPLPKAFSGM